MNLPVLMLAPVFASMIEPSVVSPGGPRSPLQRCDGLCYVFPGRPLGRPLFLRSPSQCALQDGGPRAASMRALTWKSYGDCRPARPEHFLFSGGNRAGLAVGDARRGLVVQAAKAFAFSQHRQHVEDRGRGAAPGERGTQWLRDGTEL